MREVIIPPEMSESKKYHEILFRDPPIPKCSVSRFYNARIVTAEEAKSRGYEPCNHQACDQ